MQTFVQTVVSTGGGVMQRRENLPFLHSGLIVWVDLPPDGIVERMQKSGEIAKRPLLANVRICVWVWVCMCRHGINPRPANPTNQLIYQSTDQ